MRHRSVRALLVLALAIVATPLYAVPVTVTVTGTTFSAPEGTTLNNQVVANVVDSDATVTASNLSATIDWGDGTTTPGTVSGASGTFTVTGSHTYADEGIYTTSVTVNDTKNSVSGNGGGSATIGEADVLTPGAPVSTSVAEGAQFNGTVANFTDTYTNNVASDFTATIDWGDGTTTPGTVSGGSGAFSVSGTHIYADEGTYNLQVTLTDDAPGTATAKVGATITATEGDVLNGTAVAIAPTEGAAFSGAVANFTDTYTNALASNFTATIDWGDGVTASATVTGASGAFAVSGSHTYQEEGSYVLKVTLSDVAPGTAAATASRTITVADAPLSGSAVAIAPVAGTQFSGVVANFTDADPNGTASDYTATIHWGDGTTTPGTIGPGFTVSGTHTYAAGAGGNFTLSVTINDAGGATITRTAPITVAVSPQFVPIFSPALLALLVLGLGVIALKAMR